MPTRGVLDRQRIAKAIIAAARTRAASACTRSFSAAMSISGLRLMGSANARIGRSGRKSRF